jgi:hypothetical protein
LVSISYWSKARSISIVKEYDQWSLFPMLLKCYRILHLMVEFGPMANMQTDEENSLDIFEMPLEPVSQQRRW